jgi:hypothetical protein
MKHEDVKCECGNSMLNIEKSNSQWAVYDTVCSKCGVRSLKAAREVKQIVLSSLKKGRP